MVELLKKLSQANGVSGDETTVRDIIIDEIKNHVDDIKIDSMGNIIALKRGDDSSKTIAVTANMDEPGFIVSDITDSGYIKFKAVGEIDPRKIISKKVVIGKDKVKGVIGMKAIHLQTKSERENVVKASKLFIDIGAVSKKEAKKCVSLGDYITFDTSFTEIEDRFKGKALDRSSVCTALINALKSKHQYDLCACFLAQHEVGARGADIVTHRTNPDVVLVLSTADSTDMYGCEKNKTGAVVGGGVVVNYSDKKVISDKKLTDEMIKAAEKAKINLQVKALKSADSDSGGMQTGAGGTKCLNAVIPCRYSHSPVSIMSKEDVQSTIDYIDLFLNKIGEMI